MKGGPGPVGGGEFKGFLFSNVCRCSKNTVKIELEPVVWKSCRFSKVRTKRYGSNCKITGLSSSIEVLIGSVAATYRGGQSLAYYDTDEEALFRCVHLESNGNGVWCNYKYWCLQWPLHSMWFMEQGTEVAIVDHQDIFVSWTSILWNWCWQLGWQWSTGSVAIRHGETQGLPVVSLIRKR